MTFKKSKTFILGKIMAMTKWFFTTTLPNMIFGCVIGILFMFAIGLNCFRPTTQEEDNLTSSINCEGGIYKIEQMDTIKKSNDTISVRYIVTIKKTLDN